MGMLIGGILIFAGVMTILIGGAISILYLLLMVILRRYHNFMAIPYGPFLVISAVLLLYFQWPH